MNAFLSTLLMLAAALPAAAATLDFAVNMSEPVSVTGSPLMELDVGGVTKLIPYNASTSTPSALKFSYTVSPSDEDADGIAIVSPLRLNGAHIRDAAGNTAGLTFAPPNTSGIKVGASACVSDTTVVPSVAYSNGSPYAAYISPFNLGSYSRPAQWDAAMGLMSSAFPNCTRMVWNMPNGVPAGVWGYFALSYGNYHDSAGVGVTPYRLNQLQEFKETFNWSYAGNGYFNLLSENWMTEQPGDMNTIVAEIGFLYRSSPDSIAWRNTGAALPDWTDPNGRVWDVRDHGVYITFLLKTGADLLSGTVDRKAAMDWLVTQNAISATWWVNGTGFGVEPTRYNTSSTMFIKNWNVAWSGSNPGDTAAQTLFARMASPPDAAMQTAISDFIEALITNGIWDRLDGLYLPRYLGASDMEKSPLGLSRDAVVRGGAPLFVAGQGVSFRGNSYWGTNFNPSTANGNWKQNSTFLATRVEADTGTTDVAFMGVANALMGRNTNNTSNYSRMNDASTSYYGAIGSNLYTANRTAAGNYRVKYNTSFMASVNNSSTVVTNAEMLVGRVGAGAISSNTLSIVAFGGGLTVAQWDAFVAAEAALRNAAAAAGH